MINKIHMCESGSVVLCVCVIHSSLLEVTPRC